MATNGIVGRERERETCTHKDTKSVKLGRLRSARLICPDPNATKLDMQSLQR
jgi:hypothetical protein